MDQTNRITEASSMSGLDFKIKEMAGRIRALREIEGLDPAQMAAKTGISTEEYIRCESGESDLNFAFIYRCALALNVNVTEIIEGYSPKLKSYTVTRAGAGQEIAKAHGMVYYNMAYAFQNRIAEPLFVRSAYSEEAQHKDIELTTHAGQELDIVIEGKLMVQVGEHTEVLSAGDTIYYDSDTPHGMIAVGGQDCVFYAIVLNPTGEPIPELAPTEAVPATKKETTVRRDQQSDRLRPGGCRGREGPREAGHAPRLPGSHRAAIHLQGHEAGLRPVCQLLQVPGDQEGRPGHAGAQAPLPVLVRHPGTP